MAMNSRPKVLIVAGSDSSGGAGITRDVATIAHFGVEASIAITAVTAQTHAVVIAIKPISAHLVAAQMRAALAADPIAAIKIGMMATAEVVQAIAGVLADNTGIPVVLDPVVASSSGTRLLSDPGLDRLRQRLLPTAALVTPNLPELGILTDNAPARTDAEVAHQAGQLLNMGCPAVLVKGGHMDGAQAIDTLYVTGHPAQHFASPRRQVRLRGTGCMLSSAIAAHLALGHGLLAALAAAKAFMDERFAAEAADRQKHSR